MKAGWDTKRLVDVATVSAGNPAPQDKALFDGGIYPFFRTSDVGRVRIGRLSDSEDRLNTKGIQKLKLHKAGTILLPKSGASTYLDHRVVMEVDGYVSSHLATVFPNTKVVEGQFLFYALLTVTARELSADSSYPTLSLKQVQDIEICLPPLDEQRRIVAVLDKAFAGIATATANAQKNLTNARALFENSIKEAFAKSAARVEWTEHTVESAAAKRRGAIRTGPFGSQLLHSEFVEEGIAVLGIDNAVTNDFRWDKLRFVSPEKYEALARYRVYPGDVIITIMGTCGRCAVIPDDIPLSINTKHLCCISADTKKCLPRFLHAYFLYHPVAQEYLGRTAKGSIMAGLNMGLIKEMPLHLPTIEEQKRLVELVSKFRETTDSLAVNLEAKLAALTELKQSLLHKAFAGELT